MSRMGPGYPQGYPPGQYYNQYPYRPGGGSKVGYLLFGLLCAALGLAVIVLMVKVNSLGSDVAVERKKNNVLAEKNANLQRENVHLQKAGALAGKAVYDASQLPPGAKCSRCAELMRELDATERMAEYYRLRLPPEAVEKMERSEDIAVEVSQPERTTTGVRVTYKVINRSGVVQKYVNGSVRLWTGNQIAYEQPFLIKEMAARSEQAATFEAPVTDFTRYSGHVKSGGSY